MGLAIGVLGAVRVSVDGVLVPLGGPRERAVLAVLALSRTPLAPDVLQDRVWPLGGGSRGALQVHVHNLRKRLGAHGHVLQHAGVGYSLLVEEMELDILRVIELGARAESHARNGDHADAVLDFERALGLFRGELCADLVALELDVGGARTAFVERQLSLLEAAAASALQAGGDRVADLENLVREHPYRERLWALLMIALYVQGRQAEALGAFRRAQSELLDGVGLDPGEELRAVERCILNQADPFAVIRQGSGSGLALLWLDGQGNPRRRSLTGGRQIVVGRADEADLRLGHDSRASRRHAVVRREQDGWLVEDLGSLNGTQVNEGSVNAPTPIAPGDRVRVGDTTLLVVTLAVAGPDARGDEVTRRVSEHEAAFVRQALAEGQPGSG